MRSNDRATAWPRPHRLDGVKFAICLWLAISSGAQTATSAGSGWSAYGGDAGGSRYSGLTQITPANVQHLKLAWTYQTGELGQGSPSAASLTFETTPILFDGTLYLSTAFGKIIALDPVTGKERWTFDPGTDRTRRYSEVTSRGVAVWVDPEVSAKHARIFIGTIDARLVAVDAQTGRLCLGFGRRGIIDLAASVKAKGSGNYQVTSAPTVIKDVVIVGSSIGDNWSADTGDGVVRAFDVRTGNLRWSWDPIPRRRGKVGAANAWAPMSADPERDLVFIPTSSPSPDFYGGLRPGDNRHANSVVALRASTGALVWAFQTVHHDLWDYDVAAQPTLTDLPRDGRLHPVVVQATKTGFLFVLHRETGEPWFPIEERAVPASRVKGEQAWPTQPFPVLPEPLMPQGALKPEEAWGLEESDRSEARKLIERHASAGIFTPPNLDGVITIPGNGSGVNWGGIAVDPKRHLAVANTTHLATLVQLILPEEYSALRKQSFAERGEFELGAQQGAPLAVKRKTFLTPSKLPGHPPPWGKLAAVDLVSGKIRWEIPFGDPLEWHPLGGKLSEAGVKGMPNAGGPILTASGLIFIGANMDQRFRAYDAETGRELWRAELPRAAMATPMTYLGRDQKQYVVVAAGGHGKAGTPLGDYVVAFRLNE